MDEDADLRDVLAFLAPSETAAQFLSRAHANTLPTGLDIFDRRTKLRSSNFVEVVGVHGSGKTDILLAIVANCILPHAHQGIVLGGLGNNVVFFDLDCKFDTIRLISILHTKITKMASIHSVGAGVGITSETADQIVTSSLSRFHMITCHSSFEFLVSIKTALPQLLHRLTHSNQAGVAAVFVDNAAAYYYIDKAARAPGTGGDTTGAQIKYTEAMSLQRVHMAMAEGLLKIQRLFKIPIITSRNALQASKDDENPTSWEYRDVMSKPWRDAVTHRLILKRGQDNSGHGNVTDAWFSHWTKPAISYIDKYIISSGGINEFL